MARVALQPRRARPTLVDVVLLGTLIVVAGTLVVVKPLAALALAGAVMVVGLSRMPPVALLAGAVGLTAIVPYGVQKSFGIGGSPGLLLSDVLLLAGLVWAGPRLLRLRAEGMHSTVQIAGLLVAAFVGLAALQVLRGLLAGRDTSLVGYEFRVLLGFAAFLIAIPVLADFRLRAQLLTVLPFLGLVLGAWGLAQWVLNIQFTQAADAGVRAGVRLTSSGRGQLQGGLFAFPVAILMALSALMGGAARSVRGRALLIAIVVLNVICLLLTYERTFWVATAAGVLLIVLKAGGAQRLRAAVWGLLGLLVLFSAMATVAPNELTAARERLLSLSSYGSDFSVKYRVTESRHVVEQVRTHPLIGAGLGASIFFGRPWDLVPPQSYTFSHNGYLWLAWRLGIPTALLLLVVFFWSMRLLSRPPPGPFGSVQSGARAALFTLALGSITFASFNQLGITATMGMMMAIGIWRSTEEVSA